MTCRRYTLATGVTPGLDIPLDPKRIESSRNFANKLWNSARFILGNLKGLAPDELQALAVRGPMASDELASLPLPERYIVSLCHKLVMDVTLQLEQYVLGQAGDDVQSFLWDEFADWYLEASKVRHVCVCVCARVCVRERVREEGGRERVISE